MTPDCFIFVRPLTQDAVLSFVAQPDPCGVKGMYSFSKIQLYLFWSGDS